MYDDRSKAIAEMNKGISDSDAIDVIDEKIAKEIIATQRKELVSEIESIQKMKDSKGQMGAIFDVKIEFLDTKRSLKEKPQL